MEKKSVALFNKYYNDSTLNGIWRVESNFEVYKKPELYSEGTFKFIDLWHGKNDYIYKFNIKDSSLVRYIREKNKYIVTFFGKFLLNQNKLDFIIYSGDTLHFNIVAKDNYRMILQEYSWWSTYDFQCLKRELEDTIPELINCER